MLTGTVLLSAALLLLLVCTCVAFSPSAVVPFRIGFDIDAEPWEALFVFDIAVDVYRLGNSAEGILSTSTRASVFCEQLRCVWN